MSATPTTPAQEALGGLHLEPEDDPRVIWRPSPQGFAARIAVLVVLLGIILWLPHGLPDKFVPVAVLSVTYSIIALSLNVLMGYAGQVSLGHAAFVGAGAFGGGIFLSDLGLPYPMAMLGSVLVGGLLALFLGGIALRVAGLNLAIVTISFGLLAEQSLFNIRAITGGGAGKVAPRPDFASSNEAYFYFCVVVLIAVWAFDWRLTSTKAGRAIEALRDDERVAASWGINVTSYKLLAFVITGAIAGLAGLLFAGKEEVATPQSFGFLASLTFLLMTVVGGLRSRPGVVIGGAFIAALPTILGVAHEAWGVARDDLAVCATAPPRVIQTVVGLALIGAAIELARHKFASRGGEIAKYPSALAVVGLGGLVIYGAWFDGFCMFKAIDAQAEQLFGALLLLITLIQFPGGIAQQMAPILRWLSFKKFHEDETVSIAGGAGGGAGATARP